MAFFISAQRSCLWWTWASVSPAGFTRVSMLELVWARHCGQPPTKMYLWTLLGDPVLGMSGGGRRPLRHGLSFCLWQDTLNQLSTSWWHPLKTYHPIEHPQMPWKHAKSWDQQCTAMVSAGCFHQVQSVGTFGCKIGWDGEMRENPEKGKRINNKYFSYEFVCLYPVPVISYLLVTTPQ